MFKVEHKVAFGMRTNPIDAALAFLQANSVPIDLATFDIASKRFANSDRDYHVQDFEGLIDLGMLCGFDIVVKRGVFCCVIPAMLQPMVNIIEGVEE